jgi:hypothetical protein
MTHAAENKRPGQPTSFGRLKVLLWLLAIAIGATQTWATRHTISPDGMSYLDVGETYARGDFGMGLNSYWSPLYPLLVGLGLRLIQPLPINEFVAAHWIGFVFFLGALASFEYFLREMLRSRSEGPEAGDSPMPDWAMLTLGYALFIWSSVCLVRVSAIAPDMLASCLIYLAAGLVLRLRRPHSNAGLALLLGAVLGVAYLVRAPMLPLSFVFLGVSYFSIAQHNRKKALRHTLLAAAVFLAIAAPLIAALSISRGRPTFSDAGKLNYAWYINDATLFVHWQGENAGLGRPVHPTRRILDAPAVYEFATPFKATYPPWYEPAYWNEGMSTHFNLKGHLKLLTISAGVWWQIFFMAQRGLLVVFLILLFAGREGWSRRLAGQWHLLAPVAAALALYTMLNLETRYVGPYVVLLWLVLLAAVRFEAAGPAKRLAAGVTATFAIFMLLGIGAEMREGWSAGRALKTRAQRQVVETLERMGIGTGDPVASIGDAFRAYWAHLAHVRIVAEIPSRGPYHEITAGDTDRFWSADAATQARVFDALRKAGAKAVVTDEAPACAPASGWKRISDANHHVLLLSAAETTTQAAPARGTPAPPSQKGEHE